MSVKIFLPAYLFRTKRNCDIYGEIQINDNNAVTYFVIGANYVNVSSSENKKDLSSRLRHLGHILRAGPVTAQQRRDVVLSFTYDVDTPNIYLDKLNIKSAQAAQANIFLYDAAEILQLHDCTNSIMGKLSTSNMALGDHATTQCSDVQMLCSVLRAQNLHNTKKFSSETLRIICGIVSFPLHWITELFVALMKWPLVKWMLQRTVLYEHHLEWEKFRTSKQRKANIAVDKMLGICLMLLLLFFVPHRGDYLIKTSHLIIRQLRLLLHALKGSPIGLKLNVHLNNFFLDCFNYHIDLWATFLDLIEPFVRQLFVPIALLGALGLSYQLALLADLISIIGLHTLCFYIYAAVLYKVEIKGLQVLWKVVLGKRYNMLKKRVESHNYMNRQLYLATIFFTSLLFLFPTILVYYIVFTTLRLCIYIVNLLLQLIRRSLLEFPLQLLFKWLRGNFFELESLNLQHETHTPSPLLRPGTAQMHMVIFSMKVFSSSLARVFVWKSGVLEELTTNEPSSVKNIFKRILRGTF